MLLPRLQILFAMLFASQAQAGTVQGMVTDSETGLPVAGAFVAVSVPLMNVGASTTSAADGSYSLVVDSFGNARLSSTALGYLGQTRDIVLLGANQTQLENIMLVRERFIVGRLIDADSGQSLSGRPVGLYDDSGQNIRVIQSGEDGRFVFNALSQVPYGICVIDASDAYLDECWEGQRAQYNGASIDKYTPVLPTAESTEPQLTMALTRGASLTGRLIDRQTGQALSDVDGRFVLYDVQGRRLGVAMQRTSSQGGFVLEGLLELPYFLSVGVDIPYYTHSIYPGVDCIEFACNVLDGALVVPTFGEGRQLPPLALNPGGEISGRISAADSGEPLAGIEVRRLAATAFFVIVADQTMTAEDGSFSFDHVPPGQYRIATNTASTWINQSLPGGPCPGNCGLQAGGAFLPLGINEVLNDRDLALETGVAIRGRAHRPGLSFGQQQVAVFDHQGSRIQIVNGDREGLFHTFAWLPGTYYARSGGPVTSCELYMGFDCTTPVIDGTPILLPSPGDVAEISFDLSVDLLQIDGFED